MSRKMFEVVVLILWFGVWVFGALHGRGPVDFLLEVILLLLWFVVWVYGWFTAHTCHSQSPDRPSISLSWMVVGALVLWGWGFLWFSSTYHFKNRQAEQSLSQDYREYSAWAMSGLPERRVVEARVSANVQAIERYLSSGLPDSHVLDSVTPSKGEVKAFVRKVLATTLLAFLAWFLYSSWRLHERYKRITVQIGRLMNLHASEAYLKRRERSHEDYHVFADGIQKAGSVSALLLNRGTDRASEKLAEVAESLNVRFIDEQDRCKKKARRVRNAAELFLTMLWGQWREAKEFYKEQHEHIHGSLENLITQRRIGGPLFRMQNKLARAIGGHPRRIKVTIKQQTGDVTYTGEEALALIAVNGLGAPRPEGIGASFDVRL